MFILPWGGLEHHIGKISFQEQVVYFENFHHFIMGFAGFRYKYSSIPSLAVRSRGGLQSTDHDPSYPAIWTFMNIRHANASSFRLTKDLQVSCTLPFHCLRLELSG